VNFASWLNSQSVSIRHPSPGTNKGWEARFRVGNIAEVNTLTQTLSRAGISTGKAWGKGSSFVVPVYGEESVTKIASLYKKSSLNNEDKQKTNHVTAKSEPKKETPKASFNVGDREVNQAEFTDYLSKRVNSDIQIRYQSMRARSARYWRELHLIGYDDVYIQAQQDGKDYPVKFRRDRVVEFK
jgi:hypothetical protein